MTVSVSTNKTIALGNGATTVFSFPFIGVSASDISVIYTDTSGNQTTLNSGQYSLSLNAPATGQIWGVGGTVTYPLSGSPIASGTSLTIMRTLPLNQDTSISNQGAFAPQATEGALDYDMMVSQQVNELASRAIVGNPADLTAPAALPPAAVRANQYLYFDSNGNPSSASNVAGSVAVSSAMQPVVGAASTAAAVALLNATVGSVTRSLISKLKDVLSVKDYGAVGDGVSDDTAAITSALAAINAGNGGIMYFPPGKYLCTSKISMTLGNQVALTIIGAGREVSEITWSNAAGGLALTFVANGNWTRQNGNALTISDLTFSTSATNGGDAIYISGGTAGGEPPPATMFRHLSIRGTTPTGAAQWTNGINLSGLGTASFDDISIFGADLTAQTACGVRIAGIGPSNVITQFVMSNVNGTFLDTGVNVGSYVEGVMLTGCNFSWVNTGVTAVHNVAGEQHNQCSIVNTQIQAFSFSVAIQNYVDCQIVGNLIYVGVPPGTGGTHANPSTSVGVQMTNVGRSVVAANTFAGYSQTTCLGVVWANPGLFSLGSEASVIDSNTFSGLEAGINLQSNVTGVRVGNTNAYSDTVTTWIGDTGTANVKQPSVFSTTESVALSGTSLAFTVTVPAHWFNGTPSTAFAMEANPGAEEIIAWYDPASSGALSLQFTCARRDGGTMSGTATFSIVAFT